MPNGGGRGEALKFCEDFLFIFCSYSALEESTEGTPDLERGRKSWSLSPGAVNPSAATVRGPGEKAVPSGVVKIIKYFLKANNLSCLKMLYSNLSSVVIRNYMQDGSKVKINQKNIVIS